MLLFFDRGFRCHLSHVTGNQHGSDHAEDDCRAEDIHAVQDIHVHPDGGELRCADHAGIDFQESDHERHDEDIAHGPLAPSLEPGKNVSMGGTRFRDDQPTEGDILADGKEDGEQENTGR